MKPLIRHHGYVLEPDTAAWSRCASRGSPWSWPDAFFASESERDCFERDSECHAESLACLAGHDL
jgi:hypothetical protein